jgi:hypothetical protein
MEIRCFNGLRAVRSPIQAKFRIRGTNPLAGRDLEAIASEIVRNDSRKVRGAGNEQRGITRSLREPT